MDDRKWHSLVLGTPEWMASFTNEEGLWHEREDDRERAGLEAEERARLLRWVRAQMARRLTQSERRAVELYFFEGLTYREAGARIGMNATSVYRGVARSIRKLRQAAAEDGPRLRFPRRRIR